MLKERYQYLDILKTIAIIFVCSYHFSWVGDATYSPNGLNTLILHNRFWIGMQSICVPIFFIINGALLLNKELNLKKYFIKIITLLIQFWCWRAITILLLGLFYKIPLMEIDKATIINSIFFFDSVPGIDMAHFWFIPVLISVYIIYPCIYIAFRNNNNIIFMLLICLFILAFILNDIANISQAIPFLRNFNFSALLSLNPFKGLVGPMLFYFIMGGILHKYRENLKRISYTKLCTAFFTGMFILFIQWYIISKSTTENWDSIFNGYTSIATILMSISVFIFIYKVAPIIESHTKLSKLFNLVGNNTLGIYYIHWIIGYTFLIYLKQNYLVGHGILLNYVKAIILVVIVSSLCQLIKLLPLLKKII